MTSTPINRAAVLRRRVVGGLAAAGIGAAAAVAGALGAGPASAATFEVATLNGTGDGSLAAAIEAANAAPGADTISFAPGLTGTIEMPEGVTITDSVTITGPGRDVLSLSGGGTHRILSIGIEGGTATIDVAISGLTLTAGAVTGDTADGAASDGGAVRAFATNLSLIDDSFTGNRADAYAGAVLLDGRPGTAGSLTVEGSNFEGNTSAYNGGAILTNTIPSARIANSTFTANITSTDEPDTESFGGAVIGIRSNFTIDASTFTGNTARDGGGAVSTTGETLTISGSEFDGNTATAGHGGAVVIGATDSAAISTSTFTGNTAGSGGAAIAYEDLFNTVGSLTLSDSTITDNTALAEGDNGFGGGTVAVRGPNSAQLDHVTMTGNTNPGGGAAIDAPDENVTITNSALYNPASQGEINAGSGTTSFSTVGTDPQLGPLQYNGGPTRTRLPLAGSPVIDAGDPEFPTGYPAYPDSGTDQRGLDRVVRVTDRGAVEVQNPAPVITVTTQPAPLSVTAGQPASFTADCTATQDAAVTYSWQVSTDGGQTYAPIAGATSATYTVAAATLEQNGNHYRVVCSAPGAEPVTSTAATLTVTIAPTTPPTTTPPTTTPPTTTAPTGTAPARSSATTAAAPAAAPARSLASTGAATDGYLPLGIGILALGAVMVAAATRRRRQH